MVQERRGEAIQSDMLSCLRFCLKRSVAFFKILYYKSLICVKKGGRELGTHCAVHKYLKKEGFYTS